MIDTQFPVISRVVAMLALALAACDDGGAVRVPDVEVTDGPLDGGPSDSAVLDALDAEEAEVLYPGYLCGGDDQCSTGLCYGLAGAQGHFEPAKCQSICLALYDYNRYCDSDDDCCKGRCCVDCGPREGLCVLD